MDAQRMEAIFVGAGASIGSAMLLMDEKHLPKAFKSLAARLGKYRKPAAIIGIIAGLTIALG